jgi:hypothetical protein
MRDMGKSLQEYVAAYNTLVSLQRTEDSMVKSENNLDSTVVDVVDNAAEILLAFDMQSNEFKRTQSDFEDYMERLKEDIDQKAEKFGHIEYFDAKLRDGHSNEVAIAADEVRDLDDRRKSLALVNPLFAKYSELPPKPNVEDIAFEHIALNLPIIAKNALENLQEREEITPLVGNSDEGQNLLKEEDVENEQENGEVAVELAEISEEELKEDGSENQEEELSEDEDVDDNEEEEETDESLYSEDDLKDLDDEDLHYILDNLGLEYETDEFDREQAIADILDNQEKIDNGNE